MEEIKAPFFTGKCCNNHISECEDLQKYYGSPHYCYRFEEELDSNQEVSYKHVDCLVWVGKIKSVNKRRIHKDKKFCGHGFNNTCKGLEVSKTQDRDGLEDVTGFCTIFEDHEGFSIELEYDFEFGEFKKCSLCLKNVFNNK